MTQPFHDWRKSTREGFRTRDGHLLKAFEQDPRVTEILVINRPVSALQAVVQRRLYDDFPLTGFLRTVLSVKDAPGGKVRILDTYLPEYLRPLLERRDWWRTSLEKVATSACDIGCTNRRGKSVLLLWNPLALPLLRSWRGDLVVFDAIDNWLKHPLISDHRGYVAEGYREILQRADVVIANSKAMAEFMRGLGAAPVVIPNGAARAFYTSGPWRPHRRPAGVIIAGYAGKLAKRIDVELLTAVARSRPKWRILLAGPILDRAWIRPLRRFPNIELLGDCAYAHLPELVSDWDVALIPHNVGGLENDGDPIKLYEYLALGIPVVTTPIGEVQRFRDVVTIADSTHEFIRAIELAAKSSSVTAIAKRRASVQGQFWEDRADAVLEIIEGALAP